MTGEAPLRELEAIVGPPELSKGGWLGPAYDEMARWLDSLPPAEREAAIAELPGIALGGRLPRRARRPGVVGHEPLAARHRPGRVVCPLLRPRRTARAALASKGAWRSCARAVTMTSARSS